MTIKPTNISKWPDQVQSGDEDDEEMDEGGMEAKKGRSLRGEDGEEEGEEEDVDELSVQDVDAHWLQRQAHSSML